jgi:hypothetical protein
MTQPDASRYGWSDRGVEDSGGAVFLSEFCSNMAMTIQKSINNVVREIKILRMVFRIGRVL